MLNRCHYCWHIIYITLACAAFGIPGNWSTFWNAISYLGLLTEIAVLLQYWAFFFFKFCVWISDKILSRRISETSAWNCLSNSLSYHRKSKSILVYFALVPPTSPTSTRRNTGEDNQGYKAVASTCLFVPPFFSAEHTAIPPNVESVFVCLFWWILRRTSAMQLI